MNDYFYKKLDLGIAKQVVYLIFQEIDKYKSRKKLDSST